MWKERVWALAEIGKDEDADCIKSWLRSQYAESIRERKRGAAPQDFDLISTEFHRWVRDHQAPLGLTASIEFARIIERDFAFYSRWYERLRQASEILTSRLECVRYTAQHNFTLQYPVLLAPLTVNDDEASALRKLRIVVAWLDILIHRRIWNWRAIDYSTMQYAMFLVMRDIRGKDAQALAGMLRERLDAESETLLSTIETLDLVTCHERAADPSPARTHDGLSRNAIRASIALRGVRAAWPVKDTRSSTSGPTIRSATGRSSRIRASSLSTATI